MNSLLQVKIQSNPEALPEFGHNISITINNLSGDDILLPGNFGVRMFMLKSEDWLEIENGNQYYGEDFVLHSAGHDGFTGHLKTRIRPVLPTQFQSEKNPQALRIVVIGELMAKGIKAGRYTAAYIDIFVSP